MIAIFVSYRPKTRHVGDLGNVVADQFGTVNTVIYDNVATIIPRGYNNLQNVIGKTLVVSRLSLRKTRFQIPFHEIDLLANCSFFSYIG